MRTADLRSFRSALAALATEGAPLAARDRLVIVPTRAAAALLIRSIEDRMSDADGAIVLPDFVTRADLYGRLFDRVGESHVEPSPYTGAEREALLTVACRAAIAAGTDPPFRVRAGLVAAMLDFFDSLKRHRKTIDDFERLTLARLEAGSGIDRGADRLIRQTRFFAAAFRDFEARCIDSGGVDEHAIRTIVLAKAAARPFRHIVVAVRDRPADPYGLHAVDWDVLTRVPGLEQLDVVATDTTVFGTFHERIHQWLPGIEEVRFGDNGLSRPALLVSSNGEPVHTARDREEEIAGFARWVRATARADEGLLLERMALVVRQRLPYVYLAREVFRSAGIRCQMFDALPLAAEPYAAALDVLFSFVSADFARSPAIALLRSPHFTFSGPGSGSLRGEAIASLDRQLSEAGYLGDLDALERLVESWQREGARAPDEAVKAGVVLLELARELAPLRSSADVAQHLDRLLTFLTAHASLPDPDPGKEEGPLRVRQLRARAAVHALIRGLRDAYVRFDGTAAEFDEIAAMVRRGIEAHTFAPRSGDSGIHVVDAESARFGEFDHTQLAGLVDGEWPDRPRRNIFYSPAILRDLGWPADAERVDGARASFVDLLSLPSQALVVSTFSLELDSIVGPSTFIDEVRSVFVEAGSLPPAAGNLFCPLPVAGRRFPRVFEHEALALEPVNVAFLSDAAQVWARYRLDRPVVEAGLRGRTAGHLASAYPVSALERYQDCPFKFFAADVLKLDELPEDEHALSPRARGRFIHEVFQRFFEEWDLRGGGTITSDRLDEARAIFVEVAHPLLERLPAADAALERTRLFGSAISVGIADVVLGLEAARPVAVVERWLEHRFDGEFSLGVEGGRAISLKGIADRIDLLGDRRLRVIDYKSGYAPQPKRALQVPVYALCAQEQLGEERGGDWTVDEAAYVAFTGKRTLVPVIKAGKADRDAVLAEARTRVLDIIGGVERGEFPPRPHEPRLCTYCAYPSVCRKDYVGDD